MRTTLRGSIVMLALVVAVAPVAAQPTDNTNQAPAQPTEAPPPPPVPSFTAADVAAAPIPGHESGRLDDIDPGDSVLRVLGRGGLFIPKLVVEVALSPLRGTVWAEDRYQLSELYYRVFFNADRTIGMYPTANFESGFGANIGARFEDRNAFGQQARLALQATSGAITGDLYREGALASFRTGNLVAHWLQFSLDANFERRPGDAFYGIGNSDLSSSTSTLIDPRSRSTAIQTYYRYQELRVELSAEAHFFDHIRLIASSAISQLGFSRSTTGTPIDEIYNINDLVGFGDGVEHVYSELEFRWDTRRRVSEWEPHDVHATGSLVSMYAGHIDSLDHNVDFWRYGGEVQHYWRIARGPRVLITRIHGEGVSGNLDQVAFAELPMLGGGNFLRGYSYARFRDRNAAFGSIQYEWDLSHRLDAYLFCDAGRVFTALDEMTVRGLRVGYGVGIELHSEKGFMLEGNIASSIDGGVFFNISFNPVFDSRPRWR